MADLQNNHGRKEVIVLLGPSGCGKTTFGTTRCSKESPYHCVSAFLSTGDELRKADKISPWREPNMAEIKEYCYELISKTFMDFMTSKQRELILDCVKDLDDAEFVARQANINGLKVTRALLFDIDEEQLTHYWQNRADNIDLLRTMLGSLSEYLIKWRKKSVNVINYYTKSDLLSKVSFTGTQSWRRYVKFDHPTCLPPNNLSFMLLDSDRIKNVFKKLHLTLNTWQFQFALPASFVHSYRDVNWIANPSRYYVTVKADGVRCLMLKINDGTYLITRSNDIYPCQLEEDLLAENTVLDGELLPSTFISEIQPKINPPQLKASVFLVFDVLAMSGDVLWRWPFSIRLKCLNELPIGKDIVGVMKQASASDQSLAEDMSDTGEEMLRVHCVIKEHRPSTPDDIHACLHSSFPYSLDGLIFTPDKAYVFGCDPLLFKWQYEGAIHCDLQLNPEKNVRIASKVYECRWNPATNFWDPLFVRPDKITPNSGRTVAHLKKICQQPFTSDNLLSYLAHVKMFSAQSGSEGITDEESASDHPTSSFSFDELYSMVDELVKVGEVEKTVDSSTGLEIFTYRCKASFRNPTVRLSRGLVLHPPSKAVVTRPFVRFFEDFDNRDPDEMVEATVKFDGSLGIAFVWGNEVLVTTKRRMNSEQAIWAKQWIADHCDLTMFQAGNTYLFEIIYKNNTMVVNYFFEGLVLLAITDATGRELPYEKVLHLAGIIGFFMVTPRIIGPYSEVLWYCGGIKSNEEIASPDQPLFTSGAMPVNEKRQEGWVIKFNNGTRQKMVHRWWKNAFKLAQLVQPQVVWLLLKHDKVKDVFRNAPNHFQVEIRRIVQAIGSKFEETLEQVENWHEKPNSEELNSSEELDSSEELNYSVCVFDRSGYRGGELDEREKFQASIEEPTNYRKRQLLAELESSRSDANRVLMKPREGGIGFHRSLAKHPDDVPQSDVNANRYHLSPFYDPFELNFFRLPILNYICPTSLVLEGYEPSDNFKQTWCKGWQVLSMDGQWPVVQKALQRNKRLPKFLQLPVEIVVMILDLLDHASLTSLAKVCVYLRRVIKSCKTRLLHKKFLCFADTFYEAKDRSIYYSCMHDYDDVCGSE